MSCLYSLFIIGVAITSKTKASNPMVFNKNEELEKIKQRVQNQNKKLPQGIKKCPFQSSIIDKPCTPDCMLYRNGKQGIFVCPFSELASISWTLKGSPQKK